MSLLFYKEILDQPKALKILIEYVENSSKEFNKKIKKSYGVRKFSKVIFTGMGSSLFASIPASIYLINRGVSSYYIDASELLHYTFEILDEKTLLIIVSQSGGTVEIINLLKKLKGKNLETWLFTNNKNCEIANDVSMLFDIHAGEERTTSTKTYTNTVLMLYFGARSISDDLDENVFKECYKISELISNSLSEFKKKASDIAKELTNSQYISLIGRGPSLSTAYQGALVIKETIRKFAEGMSGGQFRHGPLEITGKGHFAIVFAPSGKTYRINRNLAMEMARNGSSVLCITDVNDESSKKLSIFKLPKIPEDLVPLMEIIPIELIILNFAEIKGINIGDFSKIYKVTTTE